MLEIVDIADDREEFLSFLEREHSRAAELDDFRAS